MFLDSVCLMLLAGSGGNGAIAWRREKFIPKGGPAGGDGGKGGSILFEADRNLFALDHFRNKTVVKSPNGMPGGGANRQGKSGEDIVLKVPLGTLLKDSKTGEILHDFTTHKETLLLCQGGVGGKGNSNFATPTNRAPIIFTEGKPGEKREIELELKLIADVGFLGLPNAGKSTLLAALTSIPVKIAPYPFTTLRPNLGILTFDDFSRLHLADIPGIIEDAHLDRGLGLSFLKHIERTSVLIYVIDISGFEGRDPFEDFLLLQKELETHNKNLLEKPFLVALNQIDRGTEHLEEFKNRYPYNPETLIPLSALTKEGLPLFLKKMRYLAQKNGKKFQ